LLDRTRYQYVPFGRPVAAHDPEVPAYTWTALPNPASVASSNSSCVDPLPEVHDTV
jgi:hypothetical protein